MKHPNLCKGTIDTIFEMYCQGAIDASTVENIIGAEYIEAIVEDNYEDGHERRDRE